ncbi:MAG: c-type cytochrome [Myxococcota bacterium]|nr:c-type cytochrome [Myxococcota bacterium]
MWVQGHRVCVRKLLGMIVIPFLIQATWSGRALGDDSAMNEVSMSCSMCHGMDLVAQQRLTEAQWQGVVEKMMGWGAVVPAERQAPVIQVLAERFGLEAAPYKPVEITAAAALAKVSPAPDPDLPGGHKENGEKLYAQSCAACHGPEARGGLGLALADKPIVDQPAAFERVVREGRRLMPPLSHLDQQDIADVLAYLRGLSG